MKKIFSFVISIFVGLVVYIICDFGIAHAAFNPADVQVAKFIENFARPAAGGISSIITYVFMNGKTKTVTKRRKAKKDQKKK